MFPRMSNYHKPQPIPFYLIKCRITEKAWPALPRSLGFFIQINRYMFFV